MVYARYNCSYTSSRASSWGNVSRDRLHTSSARASIGSGTPSAPPIAKATSRPSISQRAVQPASCSEVHSSPRSDKTTRRDPSGTASSRRASSFASRSSTRSRPRGTASGIHPTQPVHRRHAVDRQHVTGNPGRDLVLLDDGHHFVERAGHDRLEPPVHRVRVPEVAATILHPFEIADGHPARVREDVGDHEDALLFEDLVRGRRGGT